MSSILIAGSSGAIGREVVKEAVADDRVARVVALSRRPIPKDKWLEAFGPTLDVTKAAQKLSVVAIDWEKLTNPLTRSDYLNAPQTWHDSSSASPPAIIEAFQQHHFVAMCLGTTRKDAGSAEAFKRCDFDYVSAFAQTVRDVAASEGNRNVLKCFSQVSSQGADANSWFLYMRTKGEADRFVSQAGLFPRVSIFRPGLLGRGDKARTVESIISCFVTPMPVKSVALAMIRDFLSPAAPSSQSSGHVTVLHNGDINRIAA
jgi:oxidoreductase